jgi:hypothetical protein
MSAQQLADYWSAQPGQEKLAEALSQLAHIEKMFSREPQDAEDEDAAWAEILDADWSIDTKVEKTLFLLERRGEALKPDNENARRVATKRIVDFIQKDVLPEYGVSTETAREDIELFEAVREVLYPGSAK